MADSFQTEGIHAQTAPPQGQNSWVVACLDWLLPGVLLLAACLAAWSIPAAKDGAIQLAWAWVPSLGIRLSFQLDGLGVLFTILISGIGSLVLVYAAGYFAGHANLVRLYFWLVLFIGAMLGLVLADNVITLFVFWELTSITSYMLIGFEHEKQQARDAALQALLVTGLGGLLLLAGLVMLGIAGGSFELSELIGRSEEICRHPLRTPIILLILLGAFTKSAQFPFHFWLPNAMAAPTPVSAYLHSATMVKAGVYLVARLQAIFGNEPLWSTTVAVVGGVTALVGGVMAISQTDLKKVLAYSTIGALGTLMLLIALGTPLATQAAVVFLLCHALYKGALFLVAGGIDHATGTRDVRALRGLSGVLPWLCGAAAFAAASMAGLPPVGGFLAKELAYESAWKLPAWGTLAVVTLFAANTVFVVVAGMVAIRPFWGPIGPTLGEAHALGWRIWAPPLVLAIIGLLVGLTPSWWSANVVSVAVSAIAPEAAPPPLKLWHGLTPALVLSGLTLALGAAAYARREAIVRAGDSLRRLGRYGPSMAYEFGLAGVKQLAARQTRFLQNGQLPIYLIVVLVSFAALVGVGLLSATDIPTDTKLLEVRLYEWFIPLLMISAALMAVLTESRLAAVCALGVIGYAAAMLFVLFGAPDLAITQLAIETLSVVLFVFVIYRLPHFAKLSGRRSKLRDGVVAVTAGGVMTFVVLAATFAHAPSQLMPYFVENSLTLAKGKNMVNVILVDFRGLDTLGEVTVLAISALGIVALMRLHLHGQRITTADFGSEDPSSAGLGAVADATRPGDSRETISDKTRRPQP